MTTTVQAHGGGAHPASISTSGNIRGGAALRVYGFDSAEAAQTAGYVCEGGPAMLVALITDAQIASGAWKAEGDPSALVVYTAQSGVTVEGGYAVPVYPVNGWGSAPAPSDPIGDALRADCVAYWTMDEASGNLLDSSVNGNHLNIFSGTTARVAGKINGALHINSTNAQAGIAATSGLTVYPGSYSISFWINFTGIITGDFIERTIWGKSGPDQSDWEFGAYCVQVTDEPIGCKITLYTYSNGVGTADLNEDVWYHVIFDRDNVSDKFHVYVNGELVNESQILEGDVDIPNAPFYFGDIKSEVGAEKFIIDEFGIFTSALTEEQRDYLYNSGAGRTLYP